jgi:hypothetical protein
VKFEIIFFNVYTFFFAFSLLACTNYPGIEAIFKKSLKWPEKN